MINAAVAAVVLVKENANLNIWYSDKKFKTVVRMQVSKHALSPTRTRSNKKVMP